MEKSGMIIKSVNEYIIISKIKNEILNEAQNPDFDLNKAIEAKKEWLKMHYPEEEVQRICDILKDFFTESQNTEDKIEPKYVSVMGITSESNAQKLIEKLTNGKKGNDSSKKHDSERQI